MAFPIAYTPSGGPIAAAANPGFSQLVAAGLTDVSGNVLSVDSSNRLQFVAGTGPSGFCRNTTTTINSIITISVFWGGNPYTLLSREVGSTHYYCQFSSTNIQFFYGTNAGTQIGQTYTMPALTVGQTYTFTFTTQQLTSTNTLLTGSVSNSGTVIASVQIQDTTSGAQNVNGTCSVQAQNPDGTHGVFSIYMNNAVPAAPTVLPYTNPPANAIQIVLDTDQGTDVDDVADIGLAAAMHRGGLINLTGIIVTNKNTYGASCASALLKYALPGNTIPIAQYNGTVSLPTNSAYTQMVTQVYGPAGDVASNYPGHVATYRKIFAAAATSSLVVVITGPVTAFMEFFNSAADGISPLTGIQLIQQKLKSLHWEAGYFQNSVVSGSTTSEYNISIDITNAQSFITLMNTYVPTLDVFWTGDDIVGFVRTKLSFEYGNLLTGFPASHGTYSPFNMAFQLFLATANTSQRPPWGQIALNYAVYGARLFAPIGYRGTNTIDGNGYNTWTTTAGQHSFLGQIAPNGVINASMNQDLIMAAPVSAAEIVPLGSGIASTPYANGAGTAYPKTIPIGRITNASSFANVAWVIPASGVPGATGTAQAGQTTFNISPQGAAEFGELLDRMVSDGRATIS